MRILVTTVAVDRSEAHLLAGLRERGFDIEVWASADRPHPHLDTVGFAARPLTVRGRLDRAAIRAIRTRVEEGTVDLVYAPHNSTLAVSLPAARARGVPVVGYRGTIGHISRWNPGDWLTYLHPRVARIACVSEAVRTYLLGFHLPPQRLVTIHRGHDPAWYVGGRFDLAACGVPAGGFRLGFAGNVRPVKGVDVLLDAVAGLPPETPLQVLIAGEIREPAIERRLRQDARLRGRVFALGHRPDAWAMLGRCDATVMPSRAREGLTKAVIESMAQGVPVIVSRVGGLPELVRDGVEGRVVPPNDAAALRAAILDMMADPARRRDWGDAARRRIETEFHIRLTIERYALMFQEAVAAPPVAWVGVAQRVRQPSAVTPEAVPA
jgi:glycosyltransferase involved in cell wall biosynthesis